MLSHFGNVNGIEGAPLLSEIHQLPVFSKTENVGDVLRDVARWADDGLFTKVVIMAAPIDGVPVMWTRGLTSLEAIALANLGARLLTDELLALILKKE